MLLSSKKLWKKFSCLSGLKNFSAEETGESKWFAIEKRLIIFVFVTVYEFEM